MDTILLAVLVVLMLIVLVVLIALIFRKNQPAADISAPLQNLTQTIEQSRRETAVITERLVRLEPLTGAVSNLQGELRVLDTRFSNLEDNLFITNQSLAEVRTDLTKTGTNTEGLIGATKVIQEQLSSAHTNLIELRTYTHAQQELERRNAEALSHLQAVIAGTNSKGVAGENILEAVFAKLPTEWQVRDFTIKGRTCEFGLRLPNNLVLPIDSKWAATNLLEEFRSCEDTAEQLRIKSLIEGALLTKAKEVRKYIDPDYTLNFGVAVVPDAVYQLCGGTLCEVFTLNVAVVSYSMFIPYLLLVFHTVLKSTQSIDQEKLERALCDSEQSIKTLQDELEGRYAKALTMLNNSRNDMSAEVGKLSSRLSSLRLNNMEAVPLMPSATDSPSDVS